MRVIRSMIRWTTDLRKGRVTVALLSDISVGGNSYPNTVIPKNHKVRGDAHFNI